MRERIAVLGPLDPLVREAMRAVCRGKVTVVELSATGKDLLRKAEELRARALIISDSEAAGLSWSIPKGLLVFGISSSSGDVVLLEEGETSHFPNPKPEAIVELLMDQGWELSIDT